jgi:hypothetical protein
MAQRVAGRNECSTDAVLNMRRTTAVHFLR